MQDGQDDEDSQDRHYDIKGKAKAVTDTHHIDNGSISNPYLALTPEEEERLRICRPPPSSGPTIGSDWEWNLPLDPGCSESEDESLKVSGERVDVWEMLDGDDETVSYTQGIPSRPSPSPPSVPLQTKLAHYHALKSSTPPIHFNTSLFSNRSFRNPHIYDKLVAYIGIDERASMRGVAQEEESVLWEQARPDKLAAAQEEYVERMKKIRDTERSQGKGRIEFTSSKRRSQEEDKDERAHRKRDKRRHTDREHHKSAR